MRNYDYCQRGWYSVTICAKNRGCYFGEIVEGEMVLSPIGQIACQCWLDISLHFPHVDLDEFIVMPDHIHGIIVIRNDSAVVGNENFRSLQRVIRSPQRENHPWYGAESRSLSSIVRGFKIGVTKWCRENNYKHFQWQKSFYDRIVRDEQSLNHIRQYIKGNPSEWKEDRL